MSYASIATLPQQPIPQATPARAESGVAVFATRSSDVITVTERVRPILVPKPNAGSKAKLKGFALKRRLKGFVSEALGETWKAVFIVNGEQIPYELPSKELKSADIKARYQPFEMDEFVPTIPGLVGKVYAFRPLAKVSAATLEAFPLDSEQTKKRNRILARFKKP
jgi:hypothetical protein